VTDERCRCEQALNPDAGVAFFSAEGGSFQADDLGKTRFREECCFGRDTKAVTEEEVAQP